MSEIFVVTDDKSLRPLTLQPYESEDLLQQLLATYPSLLAGDQIAPQKPRRWLLVKREAAVPDQENGGGRWSLDHLFLDQDGIPTLVEVKRSTDTRIRREVVGQMLDYAANGVKYWPFESLRAHFELTCESEQLDAEELLSELVGPDGEVAEFWTQVKTNLQAGRIRMLFVADHIPEELARVIEFLNMQMDPAEVLGIEIRQFTGSGIKTLVPRVIGRTTEAEDRKAVSQAREKRQWSEASYFAELEARGHASIIPVARRLLEWATPRATYVWWGQGRFDGSFIPVRKIGGKKHFFFSAFTGVPNGKPYLLFNFRFWTAIPPFDSPELMEEMIRQLSGIPGISLADLVGRKMPCVPMEVFENPESLEKLIEFLERYVAHLDALSETSPSKS